MMKIAPAPNLAALAFGIALVACATLPAPAAAQDTVRPPFTSTLSNTTPLAFGMDTGSVATALGAPLTYVRGTPGNETFAVLRMVNGNGFLFRKDPLYLQFRHGRLTGWKGDWSRGWLAHAPVF